MARPKRSIGSEGRAGNPGPPIPTKGITMKDKKEVGGGPMKMEAFLAVFGLAAAACVAGPANTNIAVWYGPESSPQTYIDGSGGIHAPTLGVSNITSTALKNGVISGDSDGRLSASTAITDATNALNVRMTAAEGATNALDVAVTALQGATNALDVRMAAAEAATNTLNDVKAAKTDVFGAPVIASEYSAGVLISTNVITLKNGAGDTTTDYAVARVWLAAAANAVSHDGTEIQKVTDKQDYWVVVTNAGTVTFVITEAATTTNTLSVSVGPNIDTETIPLTD